MPSEPGPYFVLGFASAPGKTTGENFWRCGDFEHDCRRIPRDRLTNHGARNIGDDVTAGGQIVGICCGDGVFQLVRLPVEHEITRLVSGIEFVICDGIVVFTAGILRARDGTAGKQDVLVARKRRASAVY